MFTFATARQRGVSAASEELAANAPPQNYGNAIQEIVASMAGDVFWIEKLEHFDKVNTAILRLNTEKIPENIMELARAIKSNLENVLEIAKVERSTESISVVKMFVYLIKNLQSYLARALMFSSSRATASDFRDLQKVALGADALLDALEPCIELEEIDTDQNENQEFAESIIDAGLFFAAVHTEKGIGAVDLRRKTGGVLRQVTRHAMEHVVKSHDRFSRTGSFIANRLKKHCETYSAAGTFTCDLLDLIGECDLSTSIIRTGISVSSGEASNKDLLDSSVKILEKSSESGPLHPCLLQSLDQLLALLHLSDTKLRLAAIRACRHLIVHLSKDTPLPTEHITTLINTLCQHTRDISYYCRREGLKSLAEVYGALYDLGASSTQISWLRTIIQHTVDRIKDKIGNVRAMAIELFCSIMVNNRFIHQPLVEQAREHLDSDDFKQQLEAAKEELSQATALQQTSSRQDERLAFLQEQAYAIKTEPGVEEIEDQDQFTAVAGLDPESDARLKGIRTEISELVDESQKREELVAMTTQIVDWLEDALRFAETCDEVVAWTEKLLFSPVERDLVALIRLYYCADVLRVKGFARRRKALLHLAWATSSRGDDLSKETGSTSFYSPVTVKLVGMYKSFWLDGNSEQMCAMGLVQMAGEAEQAERYSLEKLLGMMILDDRLNEIVDRDYLNGQPVPPRPKWDNVVAYVWKLFADANLDPVEERNNEIQAGVALLLSILTSINPSYALNMSHHIWDLKQPKSGPPQKSNYATYTHCFKVLRNAADIFSEEEKRDSRKQLCSLLLCSANSLEWFAFAHEAVHALTRLGEMHTLTSVLRLFCRRIYPNDFEDDATYDEEAGSSQRASNMPPEKRQMYFAQMLYIAGEAIQEVQAELDSIEQRYKHALSVESTKRAATAQDEDEDFVQQRQTAEFQFANQLEAVRKHDLLKSSSSIFELFQDKIHTVCAEILVSERMRHKRGSDEVYSPFIQVACVTALAKFMTASSDYCRDHMTMLIAILGECSSKPLQSTIMIAISDNAAQNGYVTDRYIPAIFDVLQKPDLTLKRTTTAVLTFLILGGKVKIRGKLGQMAQMLVDDNAKIRVLARTFFSEFATKEKDFFNAFMDIYSTVKKMVPLTVEHTASKEIFTFLCGLFKNKADRLATLVKLQAARYEVNSQEDLEYFKHIVTKTAALATSTGAAEENATAGPVAAVANTEATETEAREGASRPSKRAKKSDDLLEDPKLEELQKFLKNKTHLDVQKQRELESKTNDPEGEEDFDKTNQVDTTMDRGVRRRSGRHQGGSAVGTSITYDKTIHADADSDHDLDDLAEVEEQANSPAQQ